jgi:excisionase family DNA binding protein
LSIWYRRKLMEASDDILSVPEAASLMGCSDVWVIKMIHSGALEGFKLSGRAWAVSRASVEKSVAEYEQRDPSRSGRKREGHRKPLPAASKRKPLPANNSENAAKKIGYYSTRQAAQKLGCSAKTISRAAQKANVGIYLISGRLAALAPSDLPAIRAVIHETSGNPNWIADGRKRRERSKQ